MMNTCTAKGEQLQNTKYRGRPSSATAKTKHCHSLFPVGNVFVSRKRQKIILIYIYVTIQYTHLNVKCDGLCINRPSTAKCRFLVRAIIAYSSILRLCHKWHLSSTAYLLVKFGPRTRYRFVENEAISFSAISKRSTNTESKTGVSRNIYFQPYHAYSCIT